VSDVEYYQPPLPGFEHFVSRASDDYVSFSFSSGLLTKVYPNSRPSVPLRVASPVVKGRSKGTAASTPASDGPGGRQSPNNGVDY
jgi:hypothetical protein